MPRVRTYGLDKDTIAFAARVKAGSGKTILTENLKQINKFVVGIKKLGLWDTMVCWPMRSIHNAGTGSTVYSLGGASSGLNGTFFNLPTWGYNGIDFFSSPAAINQVRITPSIITPLVNEGNFMVMVASQRLTGAGRLLTASDGPGTNRRIWVYTASTTAGGFSELQHRNVNNQLGGIAGSSDFANDGGTITRSTTGTTCTVTTLRNKTIRGSLSGVTTDFSSGLSTAANTAFGSIFSNNEFTGTISYGIIITNNSNINIWNLVNDLAKSTLGTSLRIAY
jgi:hypothetical protein